MNKEFESLTKSEIKKVNKAGHGLIGEYSTKPSDVPGFVDVNCSVFDYNFEHIISEVYLVVCLFDRRKSWVVSVKEAIS